MRPSRPVLDSRPEARAETVEDLVRFVLGGRVRIPPFQRGLKWRATQVLELFDSVYRGLPIGSLLLFKRDAPAADLNLGPLTLPVPEARDARWVVDGQQRLVSLAVGLGRPIPLPEDPADPFVVYFDPLERQFKRPTRGLPAAHAWVPAPLLLDATLLGEWFLERPQVADRAQRSTVFEAGKRLREYRIPVYVVDTSEPQTLRDIFFRVNHAGRRLEWHEIHDALYGFEGDAEPPSTIRRLADTLEREGMGRLSEGEVTACVAR